MSEVHELRTRLKEDPGDSSFIELAHLLRAEGEQAEAFTVCFAGLSANPSAHRGRLTLARLFYDQEFWPFAAREVRLLLEEFPESKSLKKLLHSLAPDMAREQQQEAVKEIKESRSAESSQSQDSEEPLTEGAEDDDEGVVAEAEFDLGDDLFGED